METQFKIGDLVYVRDWDFLDVGLLPKVGRINHIAVNVYTAIYINYDFAQDEGYPYFTDDDIVINLNDNELMKILYGVK